MKYNRMYLFLLVIICLINVLNAQPIEKIADLTLRTLEDKDYKLVKGDPKILFFFNNLTKENEKILKIINRIFYSFRTRNLKVMSICYDITSDKFYKLKELKKELHLFFNLYTDYKKRAVNKIGLKQSMLFILKRDNTVSTFYEFENFDKIKYPLIRQQVKFALGFITKEQLENYSPHLDYYANSNKNFEPDTVQLSKKQIIANIEKALIAKQTKDEQDKNKKELIKTNDKKELDKVKTVLPVKKFKVDPKIIPNTKEEKSDIVFSPFTILVSMGGNKFKLTESKSCNDLEKKLFYFLGDMLINLIPLLIWGWGILYSLSKISKYNGMIFGLFACFGLFLLNAVYFLMQLPIEISVLSYYLHETKIFVLNHYHLLKQYKIETVFIILCQFALISAIAGRFKKESEYN